MKFIAYNIIALALIALAAYMVYTDKPNYGWVIFAAIVCAVFPSNNSNDKDNDTTT